MQAAFQTVWLLSRKVDGQDEASSL